MAAYYGLVQKIYHLTARPPDRYLLMSNIYSLACTRVYIVGRLEFSSVNIENILRIFRIFMERAA